VHHEKVDSKDDKEEGIEGANEKECAEG